MRGERGEGVASGSLIIPPSPSPPSQHLQSFVTCFGRYVYFSSITPTNKVQCSAVGAVRCEIAMQRRQGIMMLVDAYIQNYIFQRDC